MKNVRPGPRAWEQDLDCVACGTEMTMEESDIEVGSFKADPNTYWFDGSATSVTKFFVKCPECRRTIIIPSDDLPELVKRDARSRSLDE